MLTLTSPVRLYHGFNNSVAITRGPLVYALKIGAEWKKVKDNPQFADWEVYPTTPWNYALEIDREASRAIGHIRGTASRLTSILGRERTADREGEGPPPARLGAREGGGSSSTDEPGPEHGPARGVDPGSLRLHRPANHRVPDAG